MALGELGQHVRQRERPGHQHHEQRLGPHQDQRPRQPLREVRRDQRDDPLPRLLPCLADVGQQLLPRRQRFLGRRLILEDVVLEEVFAETFPLVAFGASELLLLVDSIVAGFVVSIAVCGFLI